MISPDTASRSNLPQIYVPEAHLPDRVRTLFEGSRSLPPDVALVATTRTFGAIPAYILLVVGLSMAVPTVLTLVNDFRSSAAGTLKPGNFKVDLIVCGVSLVIVAAMLFAGLRRLGTIRSMKAGTWRQGLFLTPEALVLRSESVCSYLPRASVVKIADTKVHFNQVPYIFPAIHFRRQNGQRPDGLLEEDSEMIAVSEDYVLSPDELQQLLERWFANRPEAPWPKGLLKSRIP